MNNGENRSGDYISINDPKNILWQLFRIWAEETEVPDDTSEKIKSKIFSKK